MALTLETTLTNAIANAVDDAINASTGAGTLQFQTSGNAEVATITFSDPAFGAADAGVITMADAPKSDTNADAGTMAKFIISNGAGTKLLTGTVSTSGADINFAGGLTVGAGDTVTLTSLTITCPAS